MKITKWRVLQKDSSIGLLLLIVGFVAMLLLILGPTTIGVKVNFGGTKMIAGIPVHVADNWAHITLGATNGVSDANSWTHTGEALVVVAMVFAAISWLAICVGWYFDPTTLDERITLSIAALGMFLALVFGIAGPAYENHQWAKLFETNKGFLAGMEILAIIPSVAALALMVDPLLMVYNKNYKSQAGLQAKAYEKDLEKQATKND